MAATAQVKVNQLAKDLGLKTKDLTDVFAEAGIEVKTQKALEPFELDLLLEKLTRANQVENIEDYIDGVTYIPSTKPAAKKPSAEEKPAPAEKPAPKQDKVPAAPAAKAPEAEPAKPAAAAQPAAPAKQEKPAEAKKPQKTVTGGGQVNPARSAGERFEDRLKKAEQANAQQKKNSDRAQAAEKAEKSPKQKQPGLAIGSAAAGGARETVTVNKNAGTRVVDTRGTGASSVDLSKYDDRLDNFVPDTVKDIKGGAQKVKKQPSSSEQGQGRPQGQRSQGGQRGAQQQSGGRFGGKQRGQQPQGRDRRQNGRRGAAPAPQQPIKKQPVHATIPDEITVGELASRLKVTAAEVIKRLMMMGVMATVNQVVDFDTAALVADELGAEVTREVVTSIEDRLFDEGEDSADDLVERAPVVCVMGHVDHGKTSLLDAIRNTHITAGEAGGITQHIGAYRVRVKGKDITFLDTPGHEAFTAMRARGAMATDIAILVVAADDGIMPQTVEAINHAKAAGVEIIVAINKMDKPGANPDNVKQELTKYDLVPEEWGGDVMCVPVSALKHTGIDDLLEDILLIAEVKEYKANPNRRAKGVIIESKLDKGRGPVATVLVQNGTLRSGDIVIAGTSVGRVRAMTDYAGRTVKAATPSMPVEITGLADLPAAGDEFNAVENERMARELAERRRSKAKEDTFKANTRANLNDLFAQISEGVKELNIIVKADVVGSAEAVKQSLEKISNDEVKVKVIHSAAGGITEGDVMFAAASNAIIVGFNVRPDKSALDSAERQGVDIRTYRVIYECIDEITAAMKGMLAPKYKEALLGHAEVRQVIHVPNVGFIAGSYVQDGKITRSSLIRVVRDGVVVFEDKISSLRRFKDDVREVAQGYECGVGLEKFNDLKPGDVLEAYVMEEVKPD